MTCEHAPTQTLWVQAALTCPRRNAHCAPKERNQPIAPCIASLLLARGPGAVYGGVRSVVVSSLQRQAMWAWTHVRQELLKTVQPCLADRDAAPAVVFESRDALVGAAGFHVCPRRIFSRSVFTVTVAVRHQSSAIDVGCEAAARPRGSVAHFCESHGSQRSAETTALNLASVVSRGSWRFRDNREPSVGFAWSNLNGTHRDLLGVVVNRGATSARTLVAPRSIPGFGQ